LTIATVSGVKIRHKYESGTSFTYSNLKVDATDDQLYALVSAFSSVQAEVPKSTSKIVATRLMSL